MSSLIHSRLDYGNFILVGLPAYLQRRLPSVLNAVQSLDVDHICTMIYDAAHRIATQTIFVKHLPPQLVTADVETFL